MVQFEFGEGRQMRVAVSTSHVTADLEVVRADEAFAVFEQMLDVPTAEGDVEQDLGGGILRGVGQEVFHFAGQDATGNEEPALLAGDSVGAGDEAHDTRLPHFGPFVRVLHMEALPGRATPFPQGVHALGARDGACRALPLERSGVHPARHRAGHFEHVEVRNASIGFIGHEILEPDAIAGGAVEQLQRDAPLGTVDDLVRDVRLTATRAVFVPSLLGQVQVAVHQRVELARRVAQVHRNDAVVLLAPASASLALHANGLLALLAKARLVDKRNRVGIGVLFCHHLQNPAPHPFMVPMIPFQKMLQGPRRHPGRERHRLHALSRQGAQLALDIGPPMLPFVCVPDAVLKPLQEPRRSATQRLHLFQYLPLVHAVSPQPHAHRHEKYRQVPAKTSATINRTRAKCCVQSHPARGVVGLGWCIRSFFGLPYAGGRIQTKLVEVNLVAAHCVTSGLGRGYGHLCEVKLAI